MRLPEMERWKEGVSLTGIERWKEGGSQEWKGRRTEAPRNGSLKE